MILMWCTLLSDTYINNIDIQPEHYEAMSLQVSHYLMPNNLNIIYTSI